MTSFLVLALFGEAVLVVILIGMLIKKGDRDSETQKVISELALLRQEHTMMTDTIRLLLHPSSAKAEQATKPAQKTEPKEYEAIRRAFNEGAEFSRDPDSEYLMDNLHDIFEALHRFGVVFMWVNDTRHEIRASFNPNDTLYGDLS